MYFKIETHKGQRSKLKPKAKTSFTVVSVCAYVFLSVKWKVVWDGWSCWDAAQFTKQPFTVE